MQMRILCDNHCDNTGCFFSPRTFKVKALPKDKFPGQLKSVLDIVKSENLVSGSRKCGIYLFSVEEIMPNYPNAAITTKHPKRRWLIP